MANLLLRHARAHPDTRILVWAHNAHVAHPYSRFVGGIRRQGEIVHEHLGDEIYTSASTAEPAALSLAAEGTLLAMAMLQ